ncbi:phospholipid scramblase-related protein [Streptomyces sp. ICBB 8177]|uniref:phospholipid scramblase-related protein n=1 Tax=Streptomyces sp. ICBB 8177 TaxID=563922 RepID=UPI000D67F721|nr:phospholipid scramblase-related protein [Streptomyces sp. ICBB 8177]PWI41713.1 Scramblase [Streptomyces sp. ICBB 8177]
MTTHSNIPAGWYADPHGTPNLLRWWDGSQWTEHTHAGTQPGARQATAQAQAPQPSVPPQPQAPQAPAHMPQAPAQAPQQGFPQQAQQPRMQGFPQQGHPQQAYAPQGGVPQEKENPWELNVGSAPDAGRIQWQVQQQAGVGPVQGGGGTLFTEPVLVVNQKAKLIEVSNEYSVFDQSGRQLGAVVEVGQSAAKKVVRFLSSYDQFMTHKLEVRDAFGQPVLMLTRPAKFIKSKVLVQRPDGTQLGEIVQQNAIGKINFGFMVGGQQIGAIKAENWRAWNFAIVDHTDTEIARITKTWEGFAKAVFTTADNYVLQIHRPLADPLLSMVVASALTVDTALKQDSR